MVVTINHIWLMYLCCGLNLFVLQVLILNGCLCYLSCRFTIDNSYSLIVNVHWIFISIPLLLTFSYFSCLPITYVVVLATCFTNLCTYLMCVFLTCCASSSFTTPTFYLSMCFEYLEFKSFLTCYLPLVLFMLPNYLCCSFCYFIYKFEYLMGVFLLVM